MKTIDVDKDGKINKKELCLIIKQLDSVADRSLMKPTGNGNIPKKGKK